MGMTYSGPPATACAIAVVAMTLSWTTPADAQVYNVSQSRHTYAYSMYENLQEFNYSPDEWYSNLHARAEPDYLINARARQDSTISPSRIDSIILLSANDDNFATYARTRSSLIAEFDVVGESPFMLTGDWAVSINYYQYELSTARFVFERVWPDPFVYHLSESNPERQGNQTGSTFQSGTLSAGRYRLEMSLMVFAGRPMGSHTMSGSGRMDLLLPAPTTAMLIAVGLPMWGLRRRR